MKSRSKKKYLYNPDNPSKSFDVYIDKNPKDTISIKYTTLQDVERTIRKLERLFKTKKYSHKRIWQVGMILKVRLEAINKYKKTKYKHAKNVYKRYKLANRYFNFLRKRSQKKTFSDRKKMTFVFNTKDKRQSRSKSPRKSKRKSPKRKSRRKSKRRKSKRKSRIKRSRRK